MQGLLSYLTDPWNIMDWMNFSLFFLTWLYLRAYLLLAEQAAAGACEPGAIFCERVGYRDDWERMDTVRSAKLYLSLCVCIQLLKLIKFMKALIPKMSLATAVLYKGVYDLFFFGLVFIIT